MGFRKRNANKSDNCSKSKVGQASLSAYKRGQKNTFRTNVGNQEC